MSDPTLIDLIRHGEPAGGPMFRGSQDDPLSDTGWAQMHQALSDEDHWDSILTSPLQRCSAFARQLAAERGLTLHEEARLREISFGDWEGLTPAEVQERHGDRLARFWDNPVDNPPPEGESMEAFHARVHEAWQEWQQRLAGQRVLVVCHGGVIRMILAEVLGIPLSRSFSVLTVPYACRSRIRIDHSPHGILTSLQRHGS